MVSQFALPKSIREETKRSDVQNVGYTKYGPALLKHLAEQLFGEGVSPRKIFKQTGWSKDVDGEWHYEYGDAGMKVREDNPNLDIQTEPQDKNQAGTRAQVFQTPKTPMKGGRDEVWTQGKNLQARFEGDTVGEMVPSPTGSQTITDPLTLNPAGAAPGNYPMLKMRQQVDPAQMDFSDTFNSNLPENEWEDGFNRPKRDPRPFNQSRNPTFGELFEHPWQQSYQPDLSAQQVEANYTFGKNEYGGSYGNFRPGGKARIYGSLGGITTPHSMEQVAAHETIGHGGQDIEGRPWGGSPEELNQADHGQEVVDLAGRRMDELRTRQKEDIAHLISLGLDPAAAKELFRGSNPNLPDLFHQYRDYSDRKVFEPYDPTGYRGKRDLVHPEKMVGYMAEAGEANARNIETRASELSDRVPMTGEKPWEQFSGGPGSDAFDQRPLRADVHPFDTMDIPPDLTSVRYYTGDENRLVAPEANQPSPGAYDDWMLKKYGMPAAATAGGAGALLGGGGEAEAAEGAAPKQDRLPHGGQQFYPFAGPPPGMGEHWSEVLRKSVGGLRNTLEGTAGGTGDILSVLPEGLKAALARTMLGAAADPRILDLLPTSEAVAGWTDKNMPAGIQDYTRRPSKDPGANVAGQAVEWGVDPLDLFGAGVMGKLARFF
jgi:hypothetical protein